MIPEHILDKYIKVWNLVDSNAPESPAARKVMQTMEKKYPGIREQAQALRSAMDGEYYRKEDTQYRAPESETRDWDEVWKEQQARREWEARQQRTDWRKVAASAFGWAASYAHQAFGVMEAQNLAERVKIEGRNNASGSLSIIARFDPNLANYASLLAPAQKEMIADMIAVKMREEIIFQLSRP